MRTSPRSSGSKSERDDDQPGLNSKQVRLFHDEREKLIKWAENNVMKLTDNDKLIRRRIKKSLQKLESLPEYHKEVFVEMLRLGIDRRIKNLVVIDSGESDSLPVVCESPAESQVSEVAEDVDPEDDDHDISTMIRKGTRKDIKKWLREHVEELSAYDSRMIAGLVVATLLDKKVCRLVLEKENDETFLTYIRGRMQKCGLVEPVSATVALPKDLEEKISGIELSEAERRALALFCAFHTVTASTKEQRVKPEGVIVATGNQEIDESNECPSCILSLQKKLENSGVTINIKEKHGPMHYGKKKGQQNFRVVWMTIEF